MDLKASWYIVILVSDKIDLLQIKINQKIEDSTYSSKKKKSSTEDTAILNIYAPNKRAAKLIKETLPQLRSHIEPHTLIVGDFSTQRLPIDSSSTQKLNKDMLKLTDVINQTDLTDICRTFDPNINISSFQHLMQNSPKLTTYLNTKQVLIEEN